MKNGWVILLLLSVLPAFGQRGPRDPRPFTARTSVSVRGQWFNRANHRAFERGLSRAERARVVKLKSRFFVPQPTGPQLAVEEGAHEVYVQFSATPDEDLRQALAASGVEILDHVTRHVWRCLATDLSALNASPDVLGVEAVMPEDKLSVRAWQASGSGGGAGDMVVSFNRNVTFQQALQVLRAAGATTAATGFDYKNKLTASLPPASIPALARDPLVRYIAMPPPPEIDHNANAAALSNVEDLYGAPYGLTGTNVHVAVRDGGAVADHNDFGDPSRVTIVEPAQTSWHATHVSGTIGGDGLGSAQTNARGMAYGAFLYSYCYTDETFAVDTRDAFTNHGARISNHSYGILIGWNQGTWYDNTSRFGDYTTTSEESDELIVEYDLVVTKSAGNDRNDDGPGHPHDGTLDGDGYYDCVGDRACAKNLITLGAVSNGIMSEFSSWGPTDDGRIKPDLVTQGVWVKSTYTNNNYAWASGTSMSAPVMAGIAALLQELYLATNSTYLPPDVLKAVAINTARDLGRAGPDFQFGWGLADALAAAETISIDGGTNTRIITGGVFEGNTDTHFLSLPDGVGTVRVTLAWTDPAGNPAAADALVNDIDLTLVTPDSNTVYYPFIMPFAQDGSSRTNVAVTGTNEWDNIEQVFVVSPTQGLWEVRVNGRALPTGYQKYALTAGTGALIAASSDAATLPFFEGFETALSNYWDAFSSNKGRIQRTNDHNPYAGSYHIGLDTTENLEYSLNELVLTIDLSGGSNVMFECYARHLGDESNNMAMVFSGHTNADGIAVSDDGTNWYRLVQLRSGVAVGYTNFEVNLSDFAATNAGLTLNEQFRIKFQQYDNYMFTSDGRCFDNITIESAIVSLSVTSAYNGAVPPVGTNWYPSGSNITCMVTNSPVTVQDTQSLVTIVCTGWTGSGSVPASGSTTNTGSFSISNGSSIVWHWAISDIVLSNQLLITTTNYTALNSITARDEYRIETPGDVSFRAGTAGVVRLEDGFIARTGSTLRVRMGAAP